MGICDISWGNAVEYTLRIVQGIVALILIAAGVVVIWSSGVGSNVIAALTNSTFIDGLTIFGVGSTFGILVISAQNHEELLAAIKSMK